MPCHNGPANSPSGPGIKAKATRLFSASPARDTNLAARSRLRSWRSLPRRLAAPNLALRGHGKTRHLTSTLSPSGRRRGRRYGSRQPPRIEFVIIREIRVQNLVDNGKTGTYMDGHK